MRRKLLSILLVLVALMQTTNLRAVIDGFVSGISKTILDNSPLQHGYFYLTNRYDTKNCTLLDSLSTKLQGDSSNVYIFTKGSKYGALSVLKDSLKLQESQDTMYKDTTAIGRWQLKRADSDSLFVMRSYANNKWLKFDKSKAIFSSEPAKLKKGNEKRETFSDTVCYYADKAIVPRHVKIEVNWVDWYYGETPCKIQLRASKDSVNWVELFGGYATGEENSVDLEGIDSYKYYCVAYSAKTDNRYVTDFSLTKLAPAHFDANGNLIEPTVSAHSDSLYLKEIKDANGIVRNVKYNPFRSAPLYWPTSDLTKKSSIYTPTLSDINNAFDGKYDTYLESLDTSINDSINYKSFNLTFSASDSAWVNKFAVKFHKKAGYTGKDGKHTATDIYTMPKKLTVYGSNDAKWDEDKWTEIKSVDVTGGVEDTCFISVDEPKRYQHYKLVADDLQSTYLSEDPLILVRDTVFKEHVEQYNGTYYNDSRMYGDGVDYQKEAQWEDSIKTAHPWWLYGKVQAYFERGDEYIKYHWYEIDTIYRDTILIVSRYFGIEDVKMTFDMSKYGEGSITLTDTPTNDCVFTLRKSKSTVPSRKADGTKAANEPSYSITSDDGNFNIYLDKKGKTPRLIYSDDNNAYEPLIVSEGWFHVTDPKYAGIEYDTIPKLNALCDTLTADYISTHPTRDATWVHNKLYDNQELPAINMRHFVKASIDTLGMRADFTRKYYPHVMAVMNTYLALDTLQHWLPTSSDNRLGTYRQADVKNALNELQKKCDNLEEAQTSVIDAVKYKSWKLHSQGTDQLWLLSTKDHSDGNTYYLNSQDKKTVFTTKPGMRTLFKYWYAGKNVMQAVVDNTYLNIDSAGISSKSMELRAALAFSTYTKHVAIPDSNKVVLYTLDENSRPCKFLYLDGGVLKTVDVYPNPDIDVTWTASLTNDALIKSIVDDEMNTILTVTGRPGCINPESTTYKNLVEKYNTMKSATGLTNDQLMSMYYAIGYAENDPNSMMMPARGFYHMQSNANDKHDYLTGTAAQGWGIKLVSSKVDQDADSTIFYVYPKDNSTMSNLGRYIISYGNGLFCNGTAMAGYGDRHSMHFELGSEYGTVASSFDGSYFGAGDDGYTKDMKSITAASSWIMTPVETISVTFPDQKLRAFSSPLPVELPDNVSAIIVVEESYGQRLVKLTGKELPANTGCFLSGSANSKAALKVLTIAPIISGDDAQTLAKSILRPAIYTQTLTAKKDTTYYTIDVTKSSPTEFTTAKYSQTGANAQIHGFGTYLAKPVSAVNMQDKIYFEVTTGITDVNANADEPDGKFFKDGVLYIRHNGMIYSADGTLIK